jgi:murein hydrolase activator
MKRLLTAALLSVWGLGWGMTVLTQAAPATPDTRQQLQQYRRNLKKGQQDLQSLKQQIHQERQHVLTVQRREKSILTELQGVEKRIDEAEERYAEDQRNLHIVQNAGEKLRTVMRETETALNEMREFLAARLRLLYREGKHGFWKTLLTSPSLSEALRRIKFFHLLAIQNAYWVERLSQTRIKLGQERQMLAQREQQARELEDASLRTLEGIRGHKQERERMLDRVRNEREAHEQAAQELTQAAENLNRLMGVLKKKAEDMERNLRLENKSVAIKPGDMTWPTRGRVTSRFGKVKHPRFNTYLHNKGIDIAGPIGQNVVASAAGRVLFAEWFEGYGRMVILDHGRGVNTLYAHLAKIGVSEGQSVNEGQSIGTLGDSGTWKGPTLYFEVRQRGEAVNPIGWLK